MTEKDTNVEETKANEEVEQPAIVPSIFKNLSAERFKDTKKVTVTHFDEVARKNQELQDKLVEERKKKNKNILRSYRIK